MGTNKAAGEKTEDWKKQASGDERKMKWNRKLKMGIKNGSNGARTHDLSRVRRTLIPAELCFHTYKYSTLSGKFKCKYGVIAGKPRLFSGVILMVGTFIF